MNTAEINNIKTTVTYKMVTEEARELSMKHHTTLYVIFRNNSIITSMLHEDGEVLSSWYFGNLIHN